MKNVINEISSKEKGRKMLQKDTDLEKICSNQDIEITLCDNEKDIYDAVDTLQKYLIPSYEERGIEIEKFAFKLKQHAKIWVIKNEIDAYVGILAAYMNNFQEKIAYLTMLVIDTEYRGRKFARKLMKLAETEAKQLGMEYFKLEVRKENIPAIGLYKKQGYRILQEATENSFYMIKKI